MRADGISVRLKAVDKSPIQEHQDTKSRASLISFASGHPFQVSVTVHTDFDWKDANHLLVSVAFDGMSSDPSAYIEYVTRRIEKAEIVSEMEYTFDRWQQNIGGLMHWVAFRMPIACLFAGGVGNFETERARIRVSLTRGKDDQYRAASTEVANSNQAKSHDALTFTFTNTRLIPNQPCLWQLPPMTNLSGYSADNRVKESGLPASKSKVEVIDLGGEDEEEGVPAKSEAVSSEQSEHAIATPTETTKSEMTSFPPSVLQPEGLKERHRARLLLELERVELQKKELAIREQLLDLDN